VNRILVATDGSPAARAAVELGAGLAAEHRAELILAHVVPALDVSPAGRLPLYGVVPHTPSERERAVLEEAAEAVAARGQVATTVLLAGHEVEEIVRCAETHDADLIVIGSRGRGALASAFLGSVSRGVLREAGRPVLIVPDGGAHWTDATGRATKVGLGF
jgi:nucleotide-binding universal stress UspA family protein